MSSLGMTSFEDVYALPDPPRGYFAALKPYGYQTPHHAQPLFLALAAELGPGRRTVLDVCCSYGINAALLNHHVTSPSSSRTTPPARGGCGGRRCPPNSAR